MGGVRKSYICNQCPWAVALKDAAVSRLLTGYSLLERWGERPPGRSDPRYWSAMLIIADEHAEIDREERPRG